ncbi:MAG: hypothetical protein J3R72DRAFT_475115 [Linnemannia gamsii]|nr:MAG: hypothetical protein J3R72DRAFT_475115 [Linnemannia gamsii]
MKQSTKATVVALATAVALCGVSSFSLPSDKQPLCGTAIAIDFGEEEFSVGLVNSNTQQLELIPNKDNEIITPSFVRIVKFLDGTQETTVGNDAIYRPFDEREMAVVKARRAKLDLWYEDNPGSNYNSSIPDPEFTYGFQPDEAYGLGWPSSFTILLEKVKEMAETKLDATVKYAVITTPSFTSADKRYPQPETTIDAINRTGLIPVRVLDKSEAAVLAYEPMIAQAERAANGRPQTIVVYNLNKELEGISVFETYHANSKEFLQLKMVAKYHFFQAIEYRIGRLLGMHLYEKYTKGLYFIADRPRWGNPNHPAEPSVHPLDKERVLRSLSIMTQRPGWAESWAPDSGDVEEKIYISEWDYVLFSHREWWDFEMAFLKKHFSRMLDRAYERSQVKAEDQPAAVDFFLMVDQSRFRNSTSAIMKETLGGKAEELVDPDVESKFAATYGAARLAEYLTKQSSRYVVPLLLIEQPGPLGYESVFGQAYIAHGLHQEQVPGWYRRWTV